MNASGGIMHGLVKHKSKMALIDGAAASAASDTWESYVEMEWRLQATAMFRSATQLHCQCCGLVKFCIRDYGKSDFVRQ